MHIKKMVTWVLSLLLTPPCIIMPETLGTAAANEAEKTGAVNAGAAAESASAGRVGKLTISGNDLSAYTITYATEINDCAKYATEELQKYLENATGVRVPVEADSDSARRIELICDESGAHGAEGFTIAVQDGNLVITGGTRRGNLYGVYEFLEQYVGYRFLTEDGEYLYEVETVDIPEGTIDTQNPVFEYRDADWNSYYGIDITVKRKIDGYTSSQSERKKLAYGDYLAKYGGGLGRSSWNSHSIGDMCGTDRQTEQPCLTDEEKYQKILNAVMDLITKRLASGQEVRQISVSQDDNENYCTCDCCFNHGLDDPNCEVNEGFTLDMEGWSKICERIYIWDYHMDFTFYLSAFPYFDQMHNNVRYFAQNNVIGYYAQGYRSGAVTGRFGELSAYMASKLAWNPNMTDEEYDKNVNEFLALYYGDGWETIRSYYDFIIESGDKKDIFTSSVHGRGKT